MFDRIRSHFTLSALALFLVSPVFAASAETSRSSTRALDAEVVFNTPGFKEAVDLEVENKLVQLINLAAPGSKIRVAQYTFDRPATALALNAASRRGVDVRIVLDGSNDRNINVATTATAIVLGANGQRGLQCASGACIKFCRGPVHIKIGSRVFGGSCSGLVINHNKFFLFSKLSNGAEDVVAQSSENLSDGQMHMYNDLIVIKNDRRLFNGMMSYWDGLFSDHTRLTAFRDAVGDSPVRAKFFPRLVGADPVLKFLERVSCQLPGSVIRVAEANFTRERVAARLRELADSGCDVKAISRFEPQMFSPSKGVMNELGHRLMILPYKGKSRAAQATNSIHTKIMLVDASIDGSRTKTPYVLTGSHNFDFFSLRTNDETLLEIQDQTIFDSYLKFWNRINEDARTSGLKLVFAKDIR